MKMLTIKNTTAALISVLLSSNIYAMVNDDAAGVDHAFGVAVTAVQDLRLVQIILLDRTTNRASYRVTSYECRNRPPQERFLSQ